MNQKLRDQVVEAVDRAVQLTSGPDANAAAEHKLLKDVHSMIQSGRFKRREELRDFEKTILCTVPIDDD